MTQPSLLDSPYIDITAAKSHSPATSREANIRVAPRKAQDRDRILGYLRWSGTATLRDIESMLRMKTQTASARLSELKATGEIEVTGERREGCAVVRIKQQ